MREGARYMQGAFHDRAPIYCRKRASRYMLRYIRRLKLCRIRPTASARVRYSRPRVVEFFAAVSASARRRQFLRIMPVLACCARNGEDRNGQRQAASRCSLLLATKFPTPAYGATPVERNG